MSDSAKAKPFRFAQEIDGIDAELMALFERRCCMSSNMRIKRQEAKPIEDKAREKQILAQKAA